MYPRFEVQLYLPSTKPRRLFRASRFLNDRKIPASRHAIRNMRRQHAANLNTDFHPEFGRSVVHAISQNQIQLPLYTQPLPNLKPLPHQSIHQRQLPLQRLTPSNLEAPRDDPPPQPVILHRLRLLQRLGVSFPVESHEIVHVSFDGGLRHVFWYARCRGRQSARSNTMILWGRTYYLPMGVLAAALILETMSVIFV